MIRYHLFEGSAPWKVYQVFKILLNIYLLMVYSQVYALKAFRLDKDFIFENTWFYVWVLLEKFFIVHQEVCIVWYIKGVSGLYIHGLV